MSTNQAHTTHPRSFLCEFCGEKTPAADLRIFFEYGEPVEICPECEATS